MKKKLYLCLLGGLGNQLFQYAYARNLQIENNFDLIIDNKTGFSLDFRDKRKFELRNISGQFKMKFVPFFLFFKIFKKIFKINKEIIFLNKKTIFDETNCKVFKKIFLEKIRGNEFFLHGYFQSERYFLSNKKLILKELMPTKPKNKLFIDLISGLNNGTCVALCLRLFSEVNLKDIKKIGGRLDVNYFNEKLKFLRRKIKDPHFYIFSNEEGKNFENFIKGLEIEKKNYTLITTKNGFKDPYDTLWALSHFKHQIISNSTFYWWGAYFAKERIRDVNILYPNNFSNKDTTNNDLFVS